jgi:hypothetical protein
LSARVPFRAEQQRARRPTDPVVRLDCPAARFFALDDLVDAAKMYTVTALPG